MEMYLWEAFFYMINAIPENYVEECVESLSCPVIRIDGTTPVEENVIFIMEQIVLSQKSNRRLIMDFETDITSEQPHRMYIGQVVEIL